MKKNIRRLLAVATVLAVMLSLTTAAFAETKSSDGDYYVTVSNDPSETGTSIDGDTFHAYQVFAAADVTSYSVTDDFRAFFTGTNMVNGNGDTYNFSQYLTVIENYEDLYGKDTEVGEDGAEPTITTVATYQTALVNYNQLAGRYMDSYLSNMYTLALQIRGYLDTVSSYAVEDGIICAAHDTATVDAVTGVETALISGLETGYYFIFDQDSTANGLGVSTTGAFMPIVTGSDYYITIEVKQSIPTMTKDIFHNDMAVWDNVADSQIGDVVDFRVISTLPNNIEDYIKDEDNTEAIDSYTYILTDLMTKGLDYQDDVVLYTDAEKLSPVDAKYLTIETSEDPIVDGYDFKVTVDAMSLLTDDPSVATLYSYYSAILTEEARVMNDYDENTATLEYSNNPHADTTETTSDTVTHFTFALDVTKLNESGEGLADARFGLFDEDGNAIPLEKVSTDYETGVVYYSYSTDVPVISDGGYITTEAVDTDANGTVIGQFQIYGLDDQVHYTLREVEAPEGYNTADAFDVYFTVYYDSLGTTITSMTDGSPYVYTSTDNAGDWSATSTIINRLKIYLPTTGGMGTMIFQVGGGTLMLGAAFMLMQSNRKKEQK